MRIILFVINFILISNLVHAQVFEDKIYDENIHTVQLYNSKTEQSFPIITLNNNESLTLLFDDLAEEYKNLSYSIQHCTADWKASNLNLMEYYEGFTENYIVNYRFSYNARQTYTHYALNFPNIDVKLLLSGNYCIKVYKTGDPEHPLFTKRFMIMDPKVQVDHLVNRSTTISDRNKKQKIDFDILYADFRVDNPLGQFNVVVMQNDRWDNTKSNIKPTFFQEGKLQFNHVDANVFDGLNEYRRMDLRSIRFLGEHVSNISIDSTNEMILLTDIPRYSERFVNDFDMNGNFMVRKIDASSPNYEADYIHVHFRFDYGSQNPYGDYYVLGKFNNWSATEKYRLKYNPTYRIYEADVLLKQGVYNYMYGFKARNASLVDIASVEGTFFETENNYRIMVYFRRTGSRYDELIAVKEFNTIR